MFKLISDVTFVVSLSGEMTNQGADNFFILIGCSVLLAVLGVSTEFGPYRAVSTFVYF